ncbi:hypothetical protein K461DRAFT_295810 [Myriangium duriaei CBS 260.36]|uniref:Large ribosomal subunit protein bL32m n=1 Tax=Myriangium duriaei CBS 260.36 TaxID=1168546 RepID=A0A9P4J199_9PEZI|nr:hypothetical protein K461DRAFT_295810 [Myriangium duriaei CBS 260.36]
MSVPLLQPAGLGLFRAPKAPSILQRCAELVTRPIAITIPWSLADIWESVLKAVPKKKPSYSKKRSRQMAGKALKDVTTLNKCPGCGRIKRAHTLCVYCVYDIKQIFKKQSKSAPRNMSTHAQPKTSPSVQKTQSAPEFSQDNPGTSSEGGQSGGSV